MDKTEQNENIQLLVAQLSEENEKLKEQLAQTSVEFAVYKKDRDESFDTAKEMITKSGYLIEVYSEEIEQLKKARAEYEKATKEIYKLKNKYKKEAEKIIDQIDR